mgnify:CR=1 FL=1
MVKVVVEFVPDGGTTVGGPATSAVPKRARFKIPFEIGKTCGGITNTENTENTETQSVGNIILNTK